MSPSELNFLRERIYMKLLETESYFGMENHDALLDKAKKAVEFITGEKVMPVLLTETPVYNEDAVVSSESSQE